MTMTPEEKLAMATKTNGESIVSPALLRELLRYEPETGRLYWRERSIEHFHDSLQFSAASYRNSWNARYAGKEAFFTVCDARGYRKGLIKNKPLMTHRVVFAIAYGHWPNGQIDHLDGDPSNNALENLRDVTQAQNARNCRIRIDNKSGTVGVYWSARDCRWYATITAGKTIHLGIFTNLDEAVIARKRAEALYGFHRNHGRRSAAIRETPHAEG